MGFADPGKAAAKSSPARAATVGATCEEVTNGTEDRSPSGATLGPIAAIQTFSAPSTVSP